MNKINNSADRRTREQQDAAPPLLHPASSDHGNAEPKPERNTATEGSTALSSVPSRGVADTVASLPAFSFVQVFRKVSRDGLLLHLACGRLTGVVPCSECCNLVR